MPIDSGPNAPKWGPARTITVAGGTFAQLLRAGQWHSSAYCPHVGMLALTWTKAMAFLLIEAREGEAPGRDGLQGGGNPRP